jgi:hypothetical protein
MPLRGSNLGRADADVGPLLTRLGRVSRQPSEQGKLARKKLKAEMTPMEKVERDLGVEVVYNTPRGETPMQANGIKARLAYFAQFEELVELEC